VAMVGRAADGMVVRIGVGLPGACSALDDAAAAEMFEAIVHADAAIDLLQRPEHRDSWNAALGRLSDSDRVHGLVAGRATRILYETQDLDADESARRMGLAVTIAADPARAAAWVDGFLRGSGEILIHDQRLFALLDGWLEELTAGAFA